MTHQAPPSVFEKCVDRSVCYTLSFYLSRKAVRSTLQTLPSRDQLRSFQRVHHDSLKLRDAIDPLFNDIADRERLGRIDDVLLGTEGPQEGKVVELTLPDHVRWTTEGTVFEASPPGLGGTRALRLRRFWYAHRDGALSYHMTFGVTYDHSPADFYFLSLLQKLAAPKEFRTNPLPKGKTAWRPTDAETGVFPLDKILLSAPGGTAAPFWRVVADQFEADAKDLLTGLAKHIGAARPKRDAASFEALVGFEPFIEVPDLEMPRVRFMFFFQDRTLFQRLLPPRNPDTGQRPARSLMVQSPCYAAYPEEIQKRMDQAQDPANPAVYLDAGYWDWAQSRYADLSDADLAAAKATIPAFERGRGDCLQYLFVAGFNQNIIDFMNQDASEVQDSIDPIYPSNEMQEEESFFVRFANPRAIVTYVETSRSLETGNDFIGTCPYAFLIHVVAMHNEFLARDYETEAFRLIEDIDDLIMRRRFHAAAGRFYAFRTDVQGVYRRDRYVGIFRYDTESDVFRAVEKVRGITRKDDYLEMLVSNAENQTRDVEARISKRDEAAISRLLGALGVFGFFGLIFNWADAAQKFYDQGKTSLITVTWHWPFLSIDPSVVETNAERIAAIGIIGSMVFLGLLLLWAVWLGYRRLRRLARAILRRRS